MNRRSFLRWLGIAPVAVPTAASVAIEAATAVPPNDFGTIGDILEIIGRGYAQVVDGEGKIIRIMPPTDFARLPSSDRFSGRSVGPLSCP